MTQIVDALLALGGINIILKKTEIRKINMSIYERSFLIFLDYNKPSKLVVSKLERILLGGCCKLFNLCRTTLL